MPAATPNLTEAQPHKPRAQTAPISCPSPLTPGEFFHATLWNCTFIRLAFGPNMSPWKAGTDPQPTPQKTWRTRQCHSKQITQNAELVRLKKHLLTAIIWYLKHMKEWPPRLRKVASSASPAN